VTGQVDGHPRVVAYTAADHARWNDFVRTSKNGTFLFHRDYMDYHADRFPDASRLVLDGDGRLIALLPATRKEGTATLASHAGLTYGGFIVDASMTTAAMLALFETALGSLRAEGIATISYTPIPHIYHQLPAEEDRYALFRFEARLVRRDVLSVVDPRGERRVQERRRRGVKKAEKAGIEVRRSADWGGFWRALEANLSSRHGTRPVHSQAEIELLAGRFKDEIALFGAFRGDELLGGVVIYESPRVAHAQYIAATEAGRELACLDLIFDQLVTRHYAHKAWFDFGISNEDRGRTLNEGLIAQKEGFGARAVVHDFYEMSI
jgi:hypothetical protein